MPKGDKLLPQQLHFIDEYLKTSNATQAYLSAYSKPNHSINKRTAGTNAYRLLKNAQIKAEIDKRLQAVQAVPTEAAYSIASPMEVLEGYTRAVRFDPGLLVDEDGQLLPVHKLPDSVRMELAGMEYSEVITEKSDGTEQNRIAKIKYKFPDKTKVRDSLCKVFNIGSDGNGIKKLLLEMLQNAGMNVTINQTINNDNRTVQFNTGPLEGLIAERPGA